MLIKRYKTKKKKTLRVTTIHGVSLYGCNDFGLEQYQVSHQNEVCCVWHLRDHIKLYYVIFTRTSIASNVDFVENQYTTQ